MIKLEKTTKMELILIIFSAFGVLFLENIRILVLFIFFYLHKSKLKFMLNFEDY